MGQAESIAAPDHLLLQAVDPTHAHGEESHSLLRPARPLQEEERVLLRVLLQELRGRRSHKKRVTQTDSSDVLPEEQAIQTEGLPVPS